MGRTEYYNDPSAPRVSTLIPVSNLRVVDDNGVILLQRPPLHGPVGLAGRRPEHR